MKPQDVPDHRMLVEGVEAFRRLVLHRLDQCGDASSATRIEIDALLALSGSGPRPLASPSPVRLPACSHLEAALALGRNGPEAGLAQAVGAIAPALRWTYSYPDDPRWPGLASAVAFTQIIGAKGLMPDERLLMGLTLIAPGTIYPRHVHPAVEFYLVIAGTALWQVGSKDAAERPPGSLIFHESGIPHAMTTEDEPLLAAFTWHGDIASPSQYEV